MNKEKEEISKLLEDCEKKKQEYFSGWQREKADFINYKNKEGERIGNLIDLLKEDLFLKIIPVLDNFNLAEQAIEKDKKQDKNIKGLLLIKKQLENILKNEGFEEINCSKFDPCLHEAIEETEEDEDGIIEIKKGYKYKEKVIRPAKVKINKKRD
jgi:molecular chaperone GrpE